MSPCWDRIPFGLAKSEKMHIYGLYGFEKNAFLFVEKFNKKYDIYDFWKKENSVHGSKRDLYFCMRFLDTVQHICTHLIHLGQITAMNV